MVNPGLCVVGEGKGGVKSGGSTTVLSYQYHGEASLIQS